MMGNKSVSPHVSVSSSSSGGSSSESESASGSGREEEVLRALRLARVDAGVCEYQLTIYTYGRYVGPGFLDPTDIRVDGQNENEQGSLVSGRRSVSSPLTI